MKELIERIKGNPKTSALGALTAAVMAAGSGMREHGLEPWASLVIGLGGLLAVVGLFVARDPK